MDLPSVPFQEKVLNLKRKFESLTPSQKVEEIIALGRDLPQIDPNLKSSDTLVKGCQSELHIHADLKEGKVFFTASSDALVSKGLAALLITIYNGSSPETIISSPPHFLEELGIHASLSPNRSQGISYIYLKMKLQTILLAKNELFSPK